MKFIFMKALSMICLLICLSGCWNSKELTEFGFLMGVSLDQSEDGNIELNAQVYSPMETVGGQGAGVSKPPYITIKTVNESIFDAARDLPRYLGRKAQWSHTRVILIGEQFAKEHDIGEVLDYFYRDHETRFTILAVITKGKAADYWKSKPFIERSMGQQLMTIIDTTSNAAGKTNRALLLDIALQLNSKVTAAIIPYLETTDDQQKSPFSSGVAVISKGKMVDRLTSGEVQNLLMLTNEFKGGIIEFPCMDDGIGKKEEKETLEVLSVKTKASPKFTEKPPIIKMQTTIEAVIGELRCSTITKKEEVKKLEAHIKETRKKEIEDLIEHLQEKKVDLLGIGNKLYKKDPSLWKKVEKDWDDIFADIQFEVDLEINIEGTGMPYGKKVTGE